MGQAGGRGKPIFATTAYEVDARGELRAVLPARCVYASPTDTCSVYVDHRRSRKTGPRYPVAVVGCTEHPVGRHTLYPPGHVPYGREAVVSCSASGPLLRAGDTGDRGWATTLFSAAVDAAGGARWPSDSPADDSRRRRTQGRRLELAGRLMGVHPELDEGTRERVATRLGVGTMTLASGARSWTRSWTQRGAAVLAVLMALALDGALLDQILASGVIVGVWTDVRRWDLARGTWVVTRASRSSPTEHPTVVRPRGRSPPPTTLHGASGQKTI